MMNPIRFGLAVAVTASLGFASAHGEGDGKDEKSPLLDNLFQDGVKVTYKPGGGVTFASEKNDFSLNITGRIQAKWYYTQLDGGAGGTDSSVSSFQARRARTKFSGHVFNEDVTYLVNLEHTNSPNVLDALVGWRFINNESSFTSIVIGVQKTRGALQSDISASTLEFSERSIATRTFADQRGTGAILQGGLMKNDNGHRLHWHVGIFNNDTAGGDSTGAATANTDSEFMYTAGLMFAGDGVERGATKLTEGDLDHNGRFQPTVGVNLAAGTAPDYNGVTGSVQTLNIFGQIKTGGGIAAQAEYWMREDEDRPTSTKADSSGWYAQASFTTKPGEGTQWGFAGRWAMIKADDPNTALAPRPSLPGTGFGPGAIGPATGDMSEGTVGINAYYHKHKLKTQLNYVYQDISLDSGADFTNNGIDIMFTLLF